MHSSAPRARVGQGSGPRYGYANAPGLSPTTSAVAAPDRPSRGLPGRPPAPAEKDRSLSYIQDDPARLKGFAWLLYNLDEFIYIR